MFDALKYFGVLVGAFAVIYYGLPLADDYGVLALLAVLGVAGALATYANQLGREAGLAEDDAPARRR